MPEPTSGTRHWSSRAATSRHQSLATGHWILRLLEETRRLVSTVSYGHDWRRCLRVRPKGRRVPEEFLWSRLAPRPACMADRPEGAGGILMISTGAETCIVAHKASWCRRISYGLDRRRDLHGRPQGQMVSDNFSWSRLASRPAWTSTRPDGVG